MAEVAISNSQEHPVLEDAAGNDKIALAQQDPNELEGQKKRLLEELESALVPKDCVLAIPKPNPNPKPNCLGFGIEVIDETALLDSIPKNGGKQSRRRASKKIHKKSVIDTVSNSSMKNEKKKNKYSRIEMEAMKFMNVSQQRKLWETIYAVLQSTFADEYDTLVATPNNRQFLPNNNNNTKPPILTGQHSFLFTSITCFLHQIIFFIMDIKKSNLVFTSCMII